MESTQICIPPGALLRLVPYSAWCFTPPAALLAVNAVIFSDWESDEEHNSPRFNIRVSLHPHNGLFTSFTECCSQ